MPRRFPLFVLFVAALAGATVALPAQITQAEYAARRDAVAAKMDHGVLVAFGARAPAQDYLSFYQASNFTYLTGLEEPDAALVIVRKNGKASATLFVPPRDPAREVWTGNRLGVEGVTRLTGLPARSVAELRPTLDSLVKSTTRLYVVGDLAGRDVLSPDAQYVQSLKARNSRLEVVDFSAAVEELRGRKSPAELALIRKAVEITVLAQQEAMRAIEPGMNEFEVQALIEYTFRRNGADRPGFASIIGSGPNATALHYNANDRFMEAGDLVVMDVGASYRGYSADVTRTVPVSGVFTGEQRAVYQLVRDAQAAAERQAQVGAAARAMSDSASGVLAVGLAKLGLIEAPKATYDAAPGTCPTPPGQACPQLFLYYMHGLGHGIGLDVHDPDQYDAKSGRIAAGSAFTLEPGVYVRANLLDILPDTPRNRTLIAKIRPVVERYRNIGVRIEDDYIVTDHGVEWISRAPREIAEIEALMKEPPTGPLPRNPAIVNWYRETETRGAGAGAREAGRP